MKLYLPLTALTRDVQKPDPSPERGEGGGETSQHSMKRAEALGRKANNNEHAVEESSGKDVRQLVSVCHNHRDETQHLHLTFGQLRGYQLRAKRYKLRAKSYRLRATSYKLPLVSSLREKPFVHSAGGTTGPIRISCESTCA